MFRVFRQHVQYFADEKPLEWKSRVYIWWNAGDSYVVEVEKA